MDKLSQGIDLVFKRYGQLQECRTDSVSFQAPRMRHKKCVAGPLPQLTEKPQSESIIITLNWPKPGSYAMQRFPLIYINIYQFFSNFMLITYKLSANSLLIIFH